MPYRLRPRRKPPIDFEQASTTEAGGYEPKPFKHARALRVAATPSEVKLWLALRRKRIEGVRFRRQHPIGPYFADFACLRAKLVIEIDGFTHVTPAEIAYDSARTRRLGQEGYKVIRFWNLDVLTNIEFVLAQIESEIRQRLNRGSAA